MFTKYVLFYLFSQLIYLITKIIIIINNFFIYYFVLMNK